MYLVSYSQRSSKRKEKSFCNFTLCFPIYLCTFKVIFTQCKDGNTCSSCPSSFPPALDKFSLLYISVLYLKNHCFGLTNSYLSSSSLLPDVCPTVSINLHYFILVYSPCCCVDPKELHFKHDVCFYRKSDQFNQQRATALLFSDK